MDVNKRHTVFGLGEVLWDILPEGKQLGGAPANFATFAGALGAQAFVVSRVGEDELGDETLCRLSQNGLETGFVSRDTEYETGKASVEVDADGVPGFVIHAPAAWDFLLADGELLEKMGKASAVCFGTLGSRNEISKRAIQKMMKAVPEGALRVLDLNLRDPFYNKVIIRECLELANVLKLNDEELDMVSTFLDMEGDESNKLKTLQKRFDLKAIALTKGANGSLLLRGDEVSEHPGIKTEVCDTIGAGDSFTAALVVGLLEGLELDVIHDRAARLASYVCSCQGATPRLPEGFYSE
jgi:fructokinase